jgi:FkbM family methyltransferase
VTGEPLVLEIHGGARVCVAPSIDQITTYVLLEQEDWFEDEIRFVRRCLRPGMRALDVGAGFGVYTLAMAQAVGKDGRIWAFEPTAATAELLRRSLALNGCRNVELTQAAVSDRAGTIAFSAGEHPELNAVGGAARPGAKSIEVAATTLDQAAARHGWDDVAFVKLDVERHESEVIRGGAAFLKSASPLLMLEVKRGDRIDVGVLEQLLELGYGLYRLAPGPLLLLPFDQIEAPDPFLLNLFACKPDRARALAESGFLAELDEDDPGRPGGDAWPGYARAVPYARDLAGAWRARAGLLSRPDVGAYYEGLAAFARSRDEAIPPARRLRWLTRAFHLVADALEADDTLERRISYARLASDLGWRAAATDSLALALGRLDSEGEEALARPFLAPSARYEQVAVAGRAGDWLRCALVERYEQLREYSSFYAGKRSLEILAPIRGLPFRSPEVDRRVNLVRLRHRELQAPERSELLREGSDENLNPSYWSGGAHA